MVSSRTASAPPQKKCKKKGLPHYFNATAPFSMKFSDLVHESPKTLDFPLALHQVRDPIQRHPRPLGAILQKPGAKPSEPASNVLP